ncbi:hypothetical protein [Zongyangia hominis]|uniref:NfeD-like C-terminal domain-containing protein n=1 Tax=Zongyangia hominis TaxID=2763677 RepID=A0A926E9Y7_9FIRM|nr:hypothetical protein [Zongyangia hominis]MBC8570037.1 hypothetical protein [Zongyangia hominis]
MNLGLVYILCIVAGLAIPVFDVIVGAVGGALDLDVDFDGDVGFDGPVSVNLMSISFSVVVFGAVGRLCLLFHLPGLVTALIGLAAGIAGGWAIGKYIIAPLKRNRSYAQGIMAQRWKEGTVKLEVRKDFVGTITVLSAVGSKVTYSAKPAPWVEENIPVGEEVLIVDVDEEKKICIVCPIGKAKEMKA